MWLTKWKWAAAGFAALALTAGGALAAILHTAPPDAPRAGPVANAEPLLAPRAPVPKPKMEEPRGPWEVATEYLQLAIADKPEEARKLCDDKAAEHIREVKSSGLKRVKFAAVLLNDQRARVVTGREPLKRHLGVGQPDNGDHFCVTLERKDGAGPWRVIGNEHLDGKSVWGATTPDGPEANQYLLSGYDVLPDPAKPNRADGAAKAPKADWDVASEFLRLALAGKTDDALKLAVPGTVSENKVGEIKKVGVTRTKAVAVLINDRRIEVFFETQELTVKRDEKVQGHPVVMLTKSRDGAWQVKDIDLRETKDFVARAEPYLAGTYDEKPAKK